MNGTSLRLFAFLLLPVLFTRAQSVRYDLPQMLAEGKIETVPAYQTQVLPREQSGGMSGAITTKGIVWLKGIDFTEGTIDIDLRGKDVFLQSFLGIAFYGADTTHTNIIYFRPFNFRHTDSTRWKWSLAYMQLPDFNYARLRKEHPGIYENKIIPPPLAAHWFHATIVVSGKQASVFVNHNSNPSLVVTLLDGPSKGLFGLYSDGLTNDFANLTITRNTPGVTKNPNIGAFNLAALFREGKLEAVKNSSVALIDSPDNYAVKVSGIAWLKDISFTKGRIDIDLRGKNEVGKSFVGIAFCGDNDSDYEAVYFRPFNFNIADSVRRTHAVQYMSLPDHDWQSLRTSYPQVFENSVSPVPDPDNWFHATMVVSEDSVYVYVDHSTDPCLKVKRFRNHIGDKIRLWSDALPGDFANLYIQP